MAAHTPGPWIWGDDFHGLYGAGPDNAVLEHYHYEGMHLGYGSKREPNAALIAAAPDLLEALKDALSQMEQDAEQIEGEWGVGRSLAELEADGRLPQEIKAARAAIAKATGQ